jgi:hypothetical protein
LRFPERLHEQGTAAPISTVGRFSLKLVGAVVQLVEARRLAGVPLAEALEPGEERLPGGLWAVAREETGRA